MKDHGELAGEREKGVIVAALFRHLHCPDRNADIRLF
jgi:hypothetical protein